MMSDAGKHRLMLMTVLETLIYDPLVDWKNTKRNKGKDNADEGEREVSAHAVCVASWLTCVLVCVDSCC